MRFTVLRLSISQLSGIYYRMMDSWTYCVPPLVTEKGNLSITNRVLVSILKYWHLMTFHEQKSSSLRSCDINIPTRNWNSYPLHHTLYIIYYFIESTFLFIFVRLHTSVWNSTASHLEYGYTHTYVFKWADIYVIFIRQIFRSLARRLVLCNFHLNWFLVARLHVADLSPIKLPNLQMVEKSHHSCIKLTREIGISQCTTTRQSPFMAYGQVLFLDKK